MASESFIIYGDVNVEITITENADGTLTFTTSVITEGADSTGLIGDINAIFFDAGEGVVVDTLMTSDGTDLATSESVELKDVFDEESVTKVDSYTNMNGEVVKEAGKFDGGVQFGTQGIGENDYQSVSFTLSTTDGSALSLADFSAQDFGIRLTSVGEEGGSRDGSLKLGGTSPEFPEEPSGVANDDYMTVFADESFSPPFPGAPTDLLDNDTFIMLDNDDGPTSVVGANNVADPGQIVYGSMGGRAIIYADGSVDFSALDDQGDSEFYELAGGETAVTEFTYQTNDGLEATLFVTVIGLDGDGPGEG